LTPSSESGGVKSGKIPICLHQNARICIYRNPSLYYVLSVPMDDYPLMTGRILVKQSYQINITVAKRFKKIYIKKNYPNKNY
jgi:hypothetical protein